MTGANPPWRATKSGLVLVVQLTPKASRDQVRGITASADGPRLAVNVRAIPDNGEANAALIVALAKWLGLAKSGLELSAGGKSRSKSVTIAGEPGEIAKLIEARLKAEA